MQALSRTTPKAPLCALTARTLAVRTLSTPPCTFSEAPSAGSKADHDLVDIEQVTGLDRLELLGQRHGVDVFNMGPLLIPKRGTIGGPTLVPAHVRDGS